MSKEVTVERNIGLFVDASAGTLLDWMRNTMDAMDSVRLASLGLSGIYDYGIHSWRKSGLTHITGCSVGITMVTIFKRACWVLPGLFEIYTAYDPVADQTVGRAAAGLDSNSADFGILPPRWNKNLKSEC